MSLMELATGSMIGLIAFNPANIGIWLPLLGLALLGYLYGE